MKILARVSAYIYLYEEIPVEVRDGASEREIEDAILEEAESVFAQSITLSNGLTSTYEIESFEKEEDK